MLPGLDKIIKLLARVAVEQHLKELQSPEQPNLATQEEDVKKEIAHEEK